MRPFTMDFETMTIAIAGAAAVAILLACLYSLRYIFRYQLRNGMLRIKMFGFLTIRRVKLNDIEETRVVPIWLPARGFQFPQLLAEAWPSWVFTRRGVLIRKRTGISRRLLLTPEKPDDFAAELLRHQGSKRP